MKEIWAAIGLMVTVPATASEASSCRVERPADGDLKSHAACYFAKADTAAIDALLACLGPNC